MFIASGDLQIEAADQRHFHVRRNQWYGKFRERSKHSARPPRIGSWADSVKRAGLHLSGYRVGPGDRSIDKITAILKVRIAAQFGAERNADIACRQCKQIGPGCPEIPLCERGAARPHRIDANCIERSLVAGCRIKPGRISRVTAVERVVSIGCRQRQIFLQRDSADPVLLVTHSGLGIKQRAFPVETQRFAAQSAKYAELFVGDIDNTRPKVGEAIAGNRYGQAFDGCIDAGQAVGIDGAIGKGDRAKGVPVIGRRHRHPDRTDGELAILHAAGFCLVIARLTEQGEVVGKVVVGVPKDVDPIKFRLD